MAATPQQQKVIDTHVGTVLVEACPGSGKTTTLVNRCKALPPNETKLVLAFNKKAADEFASRMGMVPGADVRTFHSFCFREVMQAPQIFGYKRKPSLAQRENYNGAMEPMSLLTLLKEANQKNARSWDECGWDEDFARTLEHSCYTNDLINYVENTPIKIHDFNPLLKCEEDCTQEDHLVVNIEAITARAVLTMRNWLIQNSMVTFDSMVRLCAEYAHTIRNAATHIMIDEYQDVDKFQFDIAVALAKKKVRSFVVVGDPNQRIYEWRGALQSAFDTMRGAFPNAETLPLTVNFRSHDEILEHAETICSVGMTGVRGPMQDCVTILDPNTPDAVDKFLATTQPDMSGYAILCRSNRECARWQLSLAKRGLPVFLIGKGDFWAPKHMRLAKEVWGRQGSFDQLCQLQEWKTLAAKKVNQENPERWAEIESDARWVLDLTTGDMALFDRTLQRERDGIRISTIHKTKGMEFDRVMISGVTERLMQEEKVYYVAVTRAKNWLLLA